MTDKLSEADKLLVAQLLEESKAAAGELCTRALERLEQILGPSPAGQEGPRP